MLNQNMKRLQEKILHANRISSGGLVTIKKINATFSVKAKGLLTQVFLRMLGPIGLAKTANRAKTIIAFLSHCHHLHHTQGMKGLVNYLKACQVLFQQSLGGFRLRDATELKCRPARNKAGLPKVITRTDRALIRAGDTKVMRFYLTLFALFRVLEFPGKLSLGSITDGFQGDMSKGSPYWRVIGYAPTFAKMLLDVAKENKVLPLNKRGVDPRAIMKSAPGTFGNTVSTSPWVLATQAVNLKRLGLGDCIEYFIKYFEGNTKVKFPGLLAIWQGAANLPLVLPSLQHCVGKLGFKEEAAGKVRVFAMADAWTQWLLEPFHQWMFDILRHLETDGTFDQLKPVRAKAAKAIAAYSLDLTAATDRLPISVQRELFAYLVSGEFATQWMRLLVGRGYVASSPKYGISEVLHYAVGQPMGALSSWASLAVTHHFIVQCAAWEAGVVPVGSWFKDYAVLGDDLVIFNYKVKVHYLRIVNALGVKCGIAKSLLSSTGIAIEFAKRTFWKGIDISPIPLTEFVAANLTLSDAISFSKKYNLTFPELLRCLGYGYKVVTGYQRHVGQLNSRVRALLFSYELPETEAGVQAYFNKGNPLLKPDMLKLVLQEFKLSVQADWKQSLVERLKSLQSTAVIAKAVTEDTLKTLMSLIYYSGFIKTWVTEVLPGAEETAISTEIEPLIRTMFGFRPKTFKIDENPTNQAVQVSPALFNKIEQSVRLWTLVIQRLVILVIEKPLSAFREDARSMINYWIDSLAFNRTTETTYTKLMYLHRQMSRMGSGKVPLFREEESIKWSTDPVQMRFWRLWTTSILKVMKKTSFNQGDNSSKKA